MKRSHKCNELDTSHVGQNVRLIGWVQSIRDHGGLLFVDLRDREGITQIVFDPKLEKFRDVHSLRDESVIEVGGTVTRRPLETVNPRLATGEVEVLADELTIHNLCEPLPFPMEDSKAEQVSEDLRLTYRYLDLRRKNSYHRLFLRHIAARTARNYLDENGFLEVEVPYLFKTTPEGAREFLVPSRLNPGCAYALAQSPQQYKQMLMVAGIERYYSLARCFRDEDLRADRQPEFTQIDLEMSFIDREDIYALVEGMLARIWKNTLGVDLKTPFLRMPFRDAMNDYGSDKPDMRFPMRIHDFTDAFRSSAFKVFAQSVADGGVVKAFNAKGLAILSQGEMKQLEDAARAMGAKGLAFIKAEDGQWKSPILKFLSEAEKGCLRSELGVEEGDILFFAAGKWENSCNILGRVRLECRDIAVKYGLLSIPNNAFNFLWVVDFPLMTFDGERNRYVATHHPFTAPVPEDLPILASHPHAVRGQHYDIVLNGMELGGGSIRIHRFDVQEKVLKDILKIDGDVVDSRFGYMLRAFKYGAPPHGGIALGLDRIGAIICGTSSIRDVLAFPKTQKGQDLMCQSPSIPTEKQWCDLFIKSTAVQHGKD
ncbi:MAG: aspartate--tRNA ligase [Puniceicoccales bacterium]|jgi:aspartyl-tRNA synthetase|nr:aspartate--tRNA ligase [Puniceicoccales bacterium]